MTFDVFRAVFPGGALLLREVRDMGRKRVTSLPGIFGGVDHYDENGKRVGYSLPGLFGGMDHYNADGSPAGFSTEGLFGGMDHYDAGGSPAGFSTPNVFFGSTTYGTGPKGISGLFDDDDDAGYPDGDDTGF